MPHGDSTRRGLLRVAGTLAAATLAGCSGPDGTGYDAPDGDGATGDESAGDADGTADLDLREANVVDVTVEPADAAGTYRFDVALHHDDAGEDGYANWWQVERLDGERLGRRDLAHPHAQQPFTRSATVEIPTDVGCVVVRGHDETHGYGGRAMLAAVESGETRAIDQGAERGSVAAADCP